MARPHPQEVLSVTARRRIYVARFYVSRPTLETRRIGNVAFRFISAALTPSLYTPLFCLSSTNRYNPHMRINDGLTSLVTGLGTDRSKLYSLTYNSPTENLSQYRNAYRSSPLAKRIVEQPAKDAFRKWRAWQADQQQISAIEATEKRLKVRDILERAMIEARLAGKCYVYIAVKGDEERTDEPINPERVKRNGVSRIVMLTKLEVADGDIDIDAMSPTYGEPRYYEVMSTAQLTRIHPSRMVIFYGNEKPYDFVSGRSADSVLMSLIDPIKRHEAMVDTVADMMFESVVDVVTVPGLAEMMQDPDEEAALITRFQTAKSLKSNNRVTLLNGSISEAQNSEEWQQKTISFATLPDIIKEDQIELCAATGIPHALLFGQSSGGLGSTGDMELSSYYDRVNTVQTNDVEPAISILDECIIRDALGSRPADIWYEWNSLWQMTDKEKAEIGDKIAGKWQKLVSAGVLPAEAITDAVINDLTESGVGGGIEQTYADWLAGGGMDDLQEEVDQVQIGDAAPKTLYVYRKVMNADAILSWAHEQGFTDLLDAEDLHVTLAYSRSPVDWIKMGQAWDDDVEVKSGGPRVVEELGGGAKALLFAHASLYWRNKEMREFGASWDWPDYQPHITLTYGDMPENVTPYTGEIILGPEIFEEVKE